MPTSAQAETHQHQGQDMQLKNADPATSMNRVETDQLLTNSRIRGIEETMSSTHAENYQRQGTDNEPYQHTYIPNKV